MNYIECLPVLSNNDTLALIHEAQSGNDDAKEELIKHNQGLVYKLAYHFKNCGLSFEDLCQEGNLAVVKAIMIYDEKKGASFSNVATENIFKRMVDAINKQARNIKLSQYKYRKLMLYKSTRDLLKKELQRDPSILEIAQKMNTTYESIYELFLYEKSVESLDHVYHNNKGSSYTLKEMISDNKEEPEKKLIEKDLKENVSFLLNNSKLSPDEKKVIEYRYGFYDEITHTQESIAGILGITRERVRQIEISALNKMRKNKEEIRNFLIYMSNDRNCLRQLNYYNMFYSEKKNAHKSCHKTI